MTSLSAFGVDHGYTEVEKKASYEVTRERGSRDDDLAAVGAGGVGAGAGATAASGGRGVGVRNVGRSINANVARTGSSRVLTQAKAALRAPGAARLGAGAVVGGGLAAVGAKKGVDAFKARHPHQSATEAGLATGTKVAIGVGAGALAAKGGLNVTRYNRAAKTARMFRDPQRAGRAAKDLGSIGSSKSSSDVNWRSTKSRHQPMNLRSYQEAVRTNPDIKRLRRPFDQWSASHGNVAAYRKAFSQRKPGMVQRLVNPKAEHYHNARTLRSVQDQAGPANRPLYRSAGVPKSVDIKPGGTVEMDRFSSWTDDPRIAESFSTKQRTRGKLPFAAKGRKDDVPTIYTGHGITGLHGAPASKEFAQNEWLSGGRFKVKDVQHKKGVRHVTLGPES